MYPQHPLRDKKQLFMIGLIVLLYLLLLNIAKKLFDQFVVDALLSKIDANQSKIAVILYLLLLFSAGAHLYKRLLLKAYKASILTVFLLAGVSVIYWYERFFTNDYTFALILPDDELTFRIAFLDPLFTLASLLVCILSFNYFRFSFYGAGHKSVLQQDLPIEKLNEDTYNRKLFFERLIIELKKISFDNPKGFAIGINSSWGAGKTSLLKIVKKELENDYGIICAEYNPWLAGSKLSLTQDFFVMMENELSQHTETRNLLIKYGETISKIDDDNNPLKKVSDLFKNDKSINEQFDQISDLIRRTNKRFFVIIDDLDRLDNTEVLEVLRLVRNTANFPRINFIVAYDKNYLVNALQVIKIYEPAAYLEKIFDLEMVLPKIEDRLILEHLNASVKTGLSLIIPEGDLKTTLLDQLSSLIFNSNNSDRIKILTINQAIKQLFKGKRDILKFTNSLLLVYSLTPEQLYFPDLFILELIKLKNSILYTKISGNDKYLDIENIEGIRTFKLRGNVEEGQEQRGFENRFGLYVLRETFDPRLDNVFINLVEALFDQPSNDLNSRESIIYVDNFEKYFINATSFGTFSFAELDELIYE